MPVLNTQLNPRSADFKANADAMRGLIDDLNTKLAQIAQGGGEAARAKHTARGAIASRCCWTPARPSWNWRRWPA
jgi:3-methylcrotonyl-CoA carboxylase beta subunit